MIDRFVFEYSGFLFGYIYICFCLFKIPLRNITRTFYSLHAETNPSSVR